MFCITPRWRHAWPKWQTAKSGNIRDYVGRKTGAYLEQVRTCTHCGMTQLRTEETS